MSHWFENLPLTTPADLLAATNWIILGGILLSVLEQLATHRQFTANEVYDWRVLKHGYRMFLEPRYERFFDALFGYRAYVANLVIQLAMVLLSAWQLWNGRSTVVPTGVLLGLILLSNFRNSYGQDGADQMTSIVLTGLFFCGLAPESELVRYASLAFIGMQSILSYVTAGVYKAIAPSWRSGASLTLVLSTRSYGRPDLSGLLERNPPISRTLAMGLIVFECLFFVVLFLGPHWSVTFLAAGVLFHFLNATIMGLNNFLWAFSASYPAVYFCALETSGWLYE
ncbi:MAG: hypothetical protein KDC27_11630 [Acidobacteria bacterium]|nr:hypothetical protein [Acidobacteriota bacterium]